MPIELFLYLVDLISSIFCTLIITCFCLVSAGLFVFFNMDDIRLVKKIFIYFFLILLIDTFLPSERTMYLMLGAHYLKKTNIPNKVEKIINKKLDDYLTIEDK